MTIRNAYDALSDRHRRFVDEYMIDLNGTAAAERAGYGKAGAKTRASELLARDDVKAAVSEKQAKLSQAAGVTAERVVSELAKLGFSNMLDYIEIGEDGQPYTDFSGLTRDQAAAIQEVVVESRRDTSAASVGEELEPQEHGGALKRQQAEEGPAILKVRFKLADKKGALEALGRHLGLFNDRVEHSGKIEIEHKLTDREAARRVAFLLTKATKEKTDG